MFFVKIVIILLIFISYFLGFFLRENAAGGGEADFYSHTWPLIESFKKDFFYTIDNYGIFNEASYPLSHIINAYFNPFSNTAINLQFSVTIISFLAFVFFGLAIKKIFKEVNLIDIFLTSSTILILPFFRTSAFWGLTENFGWIFLILSFYFFLKFKHKIKNVARNGDVLNIIFFCFFCACGIYSRQTLVFLPISYLLFLFFNNADKKIIIISLTSFLVFSIPGFLLIFNWGALYDVSNNLSYTSSYFSYKNIFKNIPIITSLIAFYLLPILFIEILNEGIKNFVKKYLKFMILFFVLYQPLLHLNFLDYLANYTLSGGVILKANYIIQEQNFFLLLMFSCLGFSILIRIIREDYKNNSIMLLPPILIYSFPQLLYQEYLEPLVLIIFFLGLNTQLHSVYFRRVLLSNVIIIAYFAVYLVGAIYIKHFIPLS